jgi:hypothetical protein
VSALSGEVGTQGRALNRAADACTGKRREPRGACPGLSSVAYLQLLPRFDARECRVGLREQLHDHCSNIGETPRLDHRRLLRPSDDDHGGVLIGFDELDDDGVAVGDLA